MLLLLDLGPDGVRKIVLTTNNRNKRRFRDTCHTFTVLLIFLRFFLGFSHGHGSHARVYEKNPRLGVS